MTSIKLDLHIHSIYSGDSLIKPHDAVRFAKMKGLDGFAITDHHSLKAYKIMTKIANDQNLIIIPGSEIKTHIGEIVALFINDDLEFKENENFFERALNPCDPEPAKHNRRHRSSDCSRHCQHG